MAGPAKARRESGTLEDIRTPPHSVEAEQAVLGGLLLDPVAWDNVADVVRAAVSAPARRRGTWAPRSAVRSAKRRNV